MQNYKVCLCTNTPGDSNNNAAILGSCRAARAVRPFVSRGHSLHYNPKDKAPWGATQDQVGGGIVPHSMHTSPLLQTDRKYTLQRCTYKKLKANNKREHTNGSTLTGSGGRWGKAEEDIVWEIREKINFWLTCHFHKGDHYASSRELAGWARNTLFTSFVLLRNIHWWGHVSMIEVLTNETCHRLESRQCSFWLDSGKTRNTINNRKNLVSVNENEPELQKASLISYLITEITKQ